MTPVEILRGVRDLYSNHSAWTYGCSARDATGKQTDINSETAVCWCLDGALCRVGGSIDSRPAGTELNVTILKDRGSFQSYISWNDDADRSVHDVLSLLDRTIARLESA